jgi:hypothetical protein
MVRNGRATWGVVLGRKKCFLLQKMGGDGLLKCPLGNDVSMQRKMLKGIGALN